MMETCGGKTMSPLTLEQRVAELEKQMADMKAEHANGPGKNEWRETVGMFTNDPGMLEIFADAMKIRAKDRKKGRQRATRKRERARS
jgi:hypothetical protein